MQNNNIGRDEENVRTHRKLSVLTDNFMEYIHKPGGVGEPFQSVVSEAEISQSQEKGIESTPACRQSYRKNSEFSVSEEASQFQRPKTLGEYVSDTLNNKILRKKAVSRLTSRKASSISINKDENIAISEPLEILQ